MTKQEQTWVDGFVLNTLREHNRKPLTAQDIQARMARLPQPLHRPAWRKLIDAIN